MDLKPNTNTLVVNYAVTFGLLFLILYLSMKDPTKYYYSPEFTSHQSYDAPIGCNACHVKHWKKFDDKTCWTAGCHSNFDPEKKPADIHQLTRDEFKKAKPNIGPMLAFHDQVKDMKCASCHPSHKVPTKGLLNETVITVALHAELPRMADKSPEAQEHKKSEIFHREAGRIIDIKNCASCHVGNMQQLQRRLTGDHAQAHAPAGSVPTMSSARTPSSAPMPSGPAVSSEQKKKGAEDMPNLFSVLGQ